MTIPPDRPEAGECPFKLHAWRNTGHRDGWIRCSNATTAHPPAGADLAAEQRTNERLRLEGEILKKALHIFSGEPK